MTPRAHLLPRIATPVPAPAQTPPHPARSSATRHKPTRHGALPALQSLLYLIATAIFIITFVAQPFRIPSESMEPTLLVGDFLLVNKQAAAAPSPLHLLPPTPITRGEVIVFRYPVDPSLHLVKRVIGLPGDHVRLRRGHVFVNGADLPEPYAVYRGHRPDTFRDNFPHLQTADPDVDSRWWIRLHTLVHDGELVVPPDSYFVLGDNRDNSDDSRYWGLVPRGSIVGQPFVIYFSLRDRASTPTPAPRSKHTSPPNPLIDLARWDRIFHLVR